VLTPSDNTPPQDPEGKAKTRPGLEPAYLGRTPQWATSVANTSVPPDESHSAEYSVGLT